MEKCLNCGSTNLKLYEDGSGYCLDCDDTFVNITTHIPKKRIIVEKNDEIKHNDVERDWKERILTMLGVLFLLLGIITIGLAIYYLALLNAFGVISPLVIFEFLGGAAFLYAGLSVKQGEVKKAVVSLILVAVFMLDFGIEDYLSEGYYDFICLIPSLLVLIVVIFIVLLQNHNESPPNKGLNRKLLAIIIVLIVVVASLSYFSFSEPMPINPNDPNFYDRYPRNPEDLNSIYIESSTLLWGNYTHEYASTSNLLTVQITPTIQDLANSFKDSYPDDIVQQAKAAYNYVAEEIDYVEDIDFVNDVITEVSYPVTTLTTKEGICSEYASLLASLLYAGGLKDVAIVFTTGEINGIILTHAYVAVKIPSFSPPQNSVQESIESYLGEGWIGLDPTNSLTGEYCDFAELDPTWEYHWNITTIVGVPVYGAVFTFDLDNNYDFKLGYYLDVECELYAFEHDLDNDVTFTFELREDNVPIDREVINVTCGQDTLTKIEFELGYLDDYEVDDYYDSVIIYLYIEP